MIRDRGFGGTRRPHRYLKPTTRPTGVLNIPLPSVATLPAGMKIVRIAVFNADVEGAAAAPGHDGPHLVHREYAVPPLDRRDRAFEGVQSVRGRLHPAYAVKDVVRFVADPYRPRLRRVQRHPRKIAVVADVQPLDFRIFEVRSGRRQRGRRA